MFADFSESKDEKRNVDSEIKDGKKKVFKRIIKPAAVCDQRVPEKRKQRNFLLWPNKWAKVDKMMFPDAGEGGVRQAVYPWLAQ